jgi:hypothetical protein
MNIISIYNHSDGTIVERDMTESEEANLLLIRSDAVAYAELESVKAVARLSLLDRLGITVEEAQLLLGGI